MKSAQRLRWVCAWPGCRRHVAAKHVWCKAHVGLVPEGEREARAAEVLAARAETVRRRQVNPGVATEEDDDPSDE